MRGTHRPWDSVCAPLGRSLEPLGLVACPEELQRFSSESLPSARLAAGARAQWLCQHACATWAGPPPPPAFSRESSLASVGCESRSWDVGGSLGVPGEAARLWAREWSGCTATHVLGRAPGRRAAGQAQGVTVRRRNSLWVA